ncbi:hypothetical protein JCM19235_5481 [Vibrio maritimus]|uniref:Uncharacterized protein n=1 Tax=Vibrio maritimus TaxID=990268 RepID=A0A090SBL2_9VIBR|nr:hypothetical protein JCM19235_5481 [Vibrio maritimus]
MKRRINNEDYHAIQANIEQIESVQINIKELIDGINERISTMLQESTIGGCTLGELIDQEKKETESLHEKLEHIAGENEDYLLERSDTWHESENCDLYNEWLEEWLDTQIDLDNREVIYSVDGNGLENIFELEIEALIPDQIELPDQSPEGN